jgi:hypothetical protein
MMSKLTFVKNIADWTVVNNHDTAEIGFNNREILDVCSVTLCAMLPVISSREVFSLQF